MQATSDKYSWQTILHFIITLTGLVLFLGLASLSFLMIAVGLVLPASRMNTNIGVNFILASGMFFCGLPLIPAVFSSFQRLTKKSIRPFESTPIKIWQMVVLLATWIGAVLLSDTLYQHFQWGWLAATPFFGIAIAAPIVLIAWIGIGGISFGSRNRLWGTLGVGMTVGPFLSSLLELLVIIFVIIALFFFLMLDPTWLPKLQQIVSQLQGMTNTDTIMQVLAPYLMDPLVLVSLFLVLGVFTPMIEETLKPAVVWLLGKRLQSPSQGFALGVISGAGFALVESMLAGSTPGQDWGALLAARAGGGLMHMFASGVMGWGIASALQGKRRRLLGAYLVSLTVHGLWNSAAIIIEIGSIQAYIKGTVSANPIDIYSIVGTSILGILVAITLPGLYLINRKLRPVVPADQVPPLQSDIIAPPKP